MISNTIQDIEIALFSSSLSTTDANVMTTAALAALANTNTIAAIDLANQKNHDWKIFRNAPFNNNVNNNDVYSKIFFHRFW
jgi:hypothetical protein